MPEPEITAVQRIEKYGSEAVAFFEAISAENDRGCALLAASYIDEALGVLLTDKFKRLSNADDGILKKLMKNSQGGLGSFWGRTQVAHAMGLIDENTVKALEFLGQIRNPFAHRTGPAKITDESVSPIVEQLSDALQKAVNDLGNEAYNARKLAVEKFMETGVLPPDEFGPTKHRMSFMAAATLLFLNIKLATEKQVQEKSPFVHGMGS